MRLDELIASIAVLVLVFLASKGLFNCKTFVRMFVIFIAN